MRTEVETLTIEEASDWLQDHVRLNPNMHEMVLDIEEMDDGTYRITITDFFAMDANVYRNADDDTDEPDMTQRIILVAHTTGSGVLTKAKIRHELIELVRYRYGHEGIEWLTEDGELMEEPHE